MHDPSPSPFCVGPRTNENSLSHFVKAPKTKEKVRLNKTPVKGTLQDTGARCRCKRLVVRQWLHASGRLANATLHPNPTAQQNIPERK